MSRSELDKCMLDFEKADEAAKLPVQSLRIVVVEDDPSYQTVLSCILKKQFSKTLELICLNSKASLIKFLLEHDADLILIDLNLPDSSGLSTLSGLSELAGSIPIVVLTGSDSAIGLAAVALGAQDYLEKHLISNQGLVRCLLYVLERKKYEEEKLRLSALSDFMYMLAHDLQIPLFGANRVLASCLAGDFGEFSSRQEDAIKLLKTSVEGQLDSVQKLLNVYKHIVPQKEKYRAFDMSELLQELIAEQRVMCSCELALEIADGKNFVIGDREALRVLIGNLIENAWLYGMEGSPVIVSCSTDLAGVKLAVHNFGEAVQQEVMQRLFRGFWLGMPGKSYVAKAGLGLFLCRQIARNHNARLSISSSDEDGTTLTLILPAAG